MLPVSLDCPFLIDKYFEDNNILGRYIIGEGLSGFILRVKSVVLMF
jgi:hypothetical protein